MSEARLERSAEQSLLAASREGDDEAFAELYRRNYHGALAYACSLTNPIRAQDLVAEAFARLYRLMRAGGGPDAAFRPYLWATIRSVNVDGLRRTGREVPVDEVGTVSEQTVTDTTESHAESDTVLRALRSLPQRWQDVLWATAVEGRSPRELSEELSLEPNSISALAFRAREGLKQAYLSQHIEAIPAALACSEFVHDLARYARRSLVSKRQSLVEAHVEGCRECAQAVRGLHGINDRLGAI